MHIIQSCSFKVLMVFIGLIILTTVYQIFSNPHLQIQSDNINEYYHTLLPGSSNIDIHKLDQTRSERGIPITEAIIN